MDEFFVPMMWVFFGVALLCFGLLKILNRFEDSSDRKAAEKLPPEERAAFIAARQEARGQAFLYGSLNPALVCPHCQIKGKVHIQKIDRKSGISGGKATAAVLTGGVSLLATGLSRHEAVNEAHCTNCNTTWHF